MLVGGNALPYIAEGDVRRGNALQKPTQRFCSKNKLQKKLITKKNLGATFRGLPPTNIVYITEGHVDVMAMQNYKGPSTCFFCLEYLFFFCHWSL